MSITIEDWTSLLIEVKKQRAKQIEVYYDGQLITACLLNKDNGTIVLKNGDRINHPNTAKGWTKALHVIKRKFTKTICIFDKEVALRD